jgi:hypothetical protein
MKKKDTEGFKLDVRKKDFQIRTEELGRRKIPNRRTWDGNN